MSLLLLVLMLKQGLAVLVQFNFSGFMKSKLLGAGFRNRGSLAFGNLLELIDLNFEDPSNED